MKPRFFVGVVDLDDDDFEPGEVAQILTNSSDPLASLDNTIQDMDETIQEDGPPFDNNSDRSNEGEIDCQSKLYGFIRFFRGINGEFGVIFRV